MLKKMTLLSFNAAAINIFDITTIKVISYDCVMYYMSLLVLQFSSALHCSLAPLSSLF